MDNVVMYTEDDFYRGYEKAFVDSDTEYHFDVRYGNWVSHYISDQPPTFDVAAVVEVLKELHEFSPRNFFGCPGRVSWDEMNEAARKRDAIIDKAIALGVTKVTNETHMMINC